MPSYFPDTEDDDVPRRRAGLRADELLPGESNDSDVNPPGGSNAAGTPGGGLASGGLGGTNAGDGAVGDEGLEDAMSSGILDQNGDNVDENEPESGRAGGAAGGTPAGKRSGPRLRGDG